MKTYPEIKPDFEPGDRLEVARWGNEFADYVPARGERGTVDEMWFEGGDPLDLGWMVSVTLDSGVGTALAFGSLDASSETWTGIDFGRLTGLCRNGHESSLESSYGKCQYGGTMGCTESLLPWRAGVAARLRYLNDGHALCAGCHAVKTLTHVVWQEFGGDGRVWLGVCDSCFDPADQRPGADRDESMVPPYQNEFVEDDVLVRLVRERREIFDALDGSDDDEARTAAIRALDSRITALNKSLTSGTPTGREPENVAVRYESGNEVRFFGPFVRLEAEQFMARFSEIRNRDDEMFDVTLVDLETIDLDEFDF